MSERKMTITLNEAQAAALATFIHFWHQDEQYNGVEMTDLFSELEKNCECFLDPVEKLNGRDPVRDDCCEAHRAIAHQ